MAKAINKSKKTQNGQKKSLFDDEEVEASISINSNYATFYEQKKKKEELNELSEKYKGKLRQQDGELLDEEDDESDSEEEDEEGVKDKPEWDNEFLKLLPKISKRDPEIYQPKEFFPADENEGEVKEKPEKVKPLYVQDYIRKTLLETEGKGIGSDDEEEYYNNKTKKKDNASEDEGLSIVEQQEKVRRDFLKAVNESDVGDLFTLKSKSKEEREQEEKDFKEFEAKQPKKKEKTLDDMDLLQHYWKAQQLDEKDKFLRDFILNKRWLEGNHGKSNNDKDIDMDDNTNKWSFDDTVDQEDDEAIEKQETFETEQAIAKDVYKDVSKYHFQEDFTIKTYPRQIGDSLRRDPNESRKLKRVEKNARKDQEKKKKEEELKRLKNLKKMEIVEKLQEINKITAPVFSEADLEDDFKPDEWDKKMSSMFNDDYYNQPDDNIKEVEELAKPVFEDIDGLLDSDLEDNENDNDSKVQKNKKNIRSAFQQIQHKLKDEQKRELNQILDEYYKLDYEDLIAGEIPTRFKYVEVKPSTHGLSLDEILQADDKELNRKVSIKQVIPKYDRKTGQRIDFERNWRKNPKGTPHNNTSINNSNNNNNNNYKPNNKRPRTENPTSNTNTNNNNNQNPFNNHNKKFKGTNKNTTNNSNQNNTNNNTPSTNTTNTAVKEKNRERKNRMKAKARQAKTAST